MKRTTLILVIKGNEPTAMLRAFTDGLQSAGYEIEHASARPTDEGGPIDLQIGTLSDVADVKLPAAPLGLNLSPEQAAILEAAQRAAQASEELLKRFEPAAAAAAAPRRGRGKKEGAAPDASASAGQEDAPAANAPVVEEGVGGQPEAPEGDEPAADEPQAGGNVEPNQEGAEA